MGHIRRKKAGIMITRKKLANLILLFLDEREADMAADFDPHSEAWKQILATRLSQYILERSK